MKLKTKKTSIVGDAEPILLVAKDKNRIFLRIDSFHKSDAQVRLNGDPTGLGSDCGTLHPGDYINLHGDEADIDVWCWSDNDTTINIMEVVK